MKAWWIGVLLAAVCVAGNVDAGAGRAAVRKQAEMSLLATGSVDIAADGRVAGYALDEPEKLPPVVRKLMDQAAAAWAFEPVVRDGKPSRTHAKTTLRFVAKQTGDDAFDVRIASANFDVSVPPEERPNAARRVSPQYPRSALQSGMRGTVYVVVRIGRDGRVEDAIAEQVNLRAVDTERAMDNWRRIFADEAVSALRKWKFTPPSRGEEVDAPFWRVRVPIDFVFYGEQRPAYGQWQAYIPGPRQSAPWMEDYDSQLGADAVAADGLAPLGAGPRLLTPLGG